MNISELTKESLASMIDYALVCHPEFTNDVYRKAMDDTIKYGFAAFAAPGFAVHYCAERVKNYPKIKITTAICLPFGNQTLETKKFELENLISEGLSEVDMSTNPALLLDGDYAAYENEIKTLCNMTHSHRMLFKAIIHSGFFTDEQIKTAVKIVANCGADFVKTEVGISNPGKPGLREVCLILDTLAETGTKCQMKPTTGRLGDIYAFIQAGATRIGTNIGPEAIEMLPYIQAKGIFR